MIKGIILAAGKGTRFKKKTPKGLSKINNKTLVDYHLHNFKNITDINYLIVGWNKYDFYNKNFNCIYVEQEILNGMIGAIQCVESFVNKNDTLIIVSCDEFLVYPKYKEMLYYYENNNYDLIVGYTKCYDDDIKIHSPIVSAISKNMKHTNNILLGCFITNYKIFKYINQIDLNEKQYINLLTIIDAHKKLDYFLCASRSFNINTLSIYNKVSNYVKNI